MTISGFVSLIGYTTKPEQRGHFSKRCRIRIENTTIPLEELFCLLVRGAH
jgi:hypothetical protein